MLIRENISRIKSVAGEDPGTYRVRLISAGQGSSGHYAGEMLQEYAASALPKDTLVYLDHTDEEDSVRGGTRTIRDVIGYVNSDPVYDMATESVEASIVFIPSIREDIDVLMKVVGLSIEVHDADISESGAVESLNYNPLNSIALVPVPGRDGRILSKVAESFGRASKEEGNDNMEITQEQLAAIATATATAVVEALVAHQVAEAAKAAEEAAQDEQEDAPTALEMATVLAASGLTEKQMARVSAEVESGKTLEAAIADVKEFIAEALSGVENDPAPSVGVLAEGGKGKVSNEDLYKSLVNK